MNKVKRSQTPKNRRCVKCKWVFKVKQNGKSRARLVACDYSQIRGVDFIEKYSPIIHDISARILIITMIIYCLQGKLLDVETALLYGDLKEGVYMDCPEGMVDIDEDEILLLQSTYYLRPLTKYKAVLQESDQYSQRSGIYRRYSRSLFVLPRNIKRKSLLWTIFR